MKLRQTRKHQKSNNQPTIQHKKATTVRKSKVISQPKKNSGSQLTATPSNARKKLEAVVSQVKALRKSNFK